MNPRTDGASDATRPGWRWSEWWYLVFLANLVFQPAFDDTDGAGQWVVVGVAIAVFVALYYRVLVHGGLLARWAPHLTTGLGLAVFTVNSGATVFLVYAAAFAAYHPSRRVAFRWFVGLTVLTFGLALVVPLPLPVGFAFLAIPGVLIWVVGLSCLDDVERERVSAQLRIENARIEHLATATERERLARDLHDMLGQSLTEVIVRSQLARRLGSVDPDRSVAELEQIERSARRALDEVRGAVRGWREVRIDDELDVARRGLEAAGIEVTVDRDPAFDPPPTTETALALALREATTNVVRHADAASCRIELRREDLQDVLRVADDGHGSGTYVEGNGLSGMRERTAALGGVVDRRTDAGTTITVRLPAGLPA